MKRSIRFFIAKQATPLRLSAQVTAAGLIAFLINYLLSLPQGYWTVLTAVLVVQASVGGSLKAAIDRVIGTTGGALYGGLVAVAMPHGTPGLLAGALAVGLAPPAFLAAINPSFRIAPVTVIVMLFSQAATKLGIVEFAGTRIAEIVLGSLIGLAISLALMPRRAQGVLAAEAAALLAMFAELLQTLLDPAGGTLRAALDGRHAEIRAGMARLDLAAEEARQERRLHLSRADPDPLLRQVRRVRHDLIMIGRAGTPAPALEARAVLAPPLLALSLETARFLRELSLFIIDGEPQPPAAGAMEAAFNGFAATLAALRRDGQLEADDVERLHTLGFALAQLRQNLRDLSDRITELHAAPVLPPPAPV